jgi:aspartyl-tRNA(Asn)/glutamyl-tRNA(Gln) amidotransferase subunit A
MDKPTSNTRASFRQAVEEAQTYSPDGNARRPAFISSVSRMAKKQRRNVKALPLSSRQGRLGPVADAGDRMVAGSTTALEQTKLALEAIARFQPELNAFSHIAPRAALLEQAESLDRERVAGKIRSPLHGLPISIKDVIHVKGMPTGSGSKVMEGFMPNDDATVVKLLREAGAIIIGKAHTHEFALGVTTPQSRNPWDSSRDPGGSSGGSAISVATGMSLLSVGTDTRASIRVPASLCGTLGYKPTYGLVSTDGVVTLSWSMDHTGLMGRTSEDVAILMNVLQGPDSRDPGTLDRDNDDYTAYLFKDVTGFRVGLPVEALEGTDPETLTTFQACVKTLESLGVEVVETRLPSSDDFRLANNLGLIISRVEAAAYHSGFPDAGPKYINQVFEQLDEAAQVKGVDYINAQRFRSEFQERMLAELQGFDAFIMPTTPVPAPKSEDSEQYLTILSRNCIPWSMIGFPTLSVPAGLTPEGLPVGAQLVSAPFDDGIILALASALESVTEDLRPRSS